MKKLTKNQKTPNKLTPYEEKEFEKLCQGIIGSKLFRRLLGFAGLKIFLGFR